VYFDAGVRNASGSGLFQSLVFAYRNRTIRCKWPGSAFEATVRFYAGGIRKFGAFLRCKKRAAWQAIAKAPKHGWWWASPLGH